MWKLYLAGRTSWRDKVKHTEGIKKILVEEPQFYSNITRQTMASAVQPGHMLGGSSGINAVSMLESRLNGVKPQCRGQEGIIEWLVISLMSSIF